MPFKLLSEDHVSEFRRKKKAIFQSDYSPIHSMVTLLYRTLQSALRYDTVIRRTSVMAVGSDIAVKIAGKPLQIETWLQTI